MSFCSEQLKICLVRKCSIPIKSASSKLAQSAAPSGVVHFHPAHFKRITSPLECKSLLSYPYQCLFTVISWLGVINFHCNRHITRSTEIYQCRYPAIRLFGSDKARMQTESCSNSELFPVAGDVRLWQNVN